LIQHPWLKLQADHSTTPTPSQSPSPTADYNATNNGSAGLPTTTPTPPTTPTENLQDLLVRIWLIQHPWLKLQADHSTTPTPSQSPSPTADYNATNNGSAGLPTTTPTPPTTPTENLQDLLVRIWLIQHPWLKLQADHSTTPTPSQSPSPTADYNATNNGSAGLPTTTPTPPTTPTENLQDLLVRIWLIQHPWLKLQADHSTTPTPSQSPSPTADYNATNNGSAGLPTTTPTPPTTPTENLQDLLVRIWLIQHPWLKLQADHSTTPTPSQSPSPTADYNATNNGSAGLPTTTPTPPTTPTENLQDLLVRIWLLQHPWLKLQADHSTTPTPSQSPSPTADYNATNNGSAGLPTTTPTTTPTENLQDLLVRIWLIQHPWLKLQADHSTTPTPSQSPSPTADYNATNNGSAGLPTTTPTPPTTPTENLQDLLVRIWLIQHPWLKLQADHSTTPTPSQSPSPTADYNATNNGSAGLPTTTPTTTPTALLRFGWSNVAQTTSARTVAVADRYNATNNGTTPTPPTTPTENLQDLLVRIWLIQHPWLKLQADHSTTPTPSQSPSPTADYNATNNGSAGLPTTTPTPPTTPTENLQDLLVRIWLIQHPWLKLQADHSTTPTPSQSPSPTADYNATNNGSAGLPTTTPTPPTTPTENLQDLLVRIWLIQHPWLKLQADHSTTPTPSQSPSPTADYNATNNGSAGLPTTTPTPPTTPTENLQDLLVRIWLIQHPWLKLQADHSTTPTPSQSPSPTADYNATNNGSAGLPTTTPTPPTTPTENLQDLLVRIWLLQHPWLKLQADHSTTPTPSQSPSPTADYNATNNGSAGLPTTTPTPPTTPTENLQDLLVRIWLIQHPWLKLQADHSTTPTPSQSPSPTADYNATNNGSAGLPTTTPTPPTTPTENLQDLLVRIWLIQHPWLKLQADHSTTPTPSQSPSPTADYNATNNGSAGLPTTTPTPPTTPTENLQDLLVRIWLLQHPWLKLQADHSTTPTPSQSPSPTADYNATNNGSAGLPTTTPTPPTTPTENLQDLLVRIWLIQHPWLKLQADHSTTPTPSQSPSPTADYNATNNGSAGLPTTTPTPPTTPTENLQDLLVRIWLLQHPWLKLQADHSTTPTPSQSPSPTADYNATNNGSAGLPTTTPTPPTTPTENLQDLLVRIWLIQHPWLKLQADHSTTPTPSQSPSPTADYNATNNGSAGLPTTTPTPPTTPTENLQDLLVRIWLLQHPWLKLQADHSTTPTPSQSPSPTADYNATNNGSAGLPTTTPTPPTTPTENLQDLLVRIWLLQHPWLKLQADHSTTPTPSQSPSPTADYNATNNGSAGLPTTTPTPPTTPTENLQDLLVRIWLLQHPWFKLQADHSTTPTPSQSPSPTADYNATNNGSAGLPTTTPTPPTTPTENLQDLLVRIWLLQHPWLKLQADHSTTPTPSQSPSPTADYNATNNGSAGLPTTTPTPPTTPTENLQDLLVRIWLIQHPWLKLQADHSTTPTPSQSPSPTADYNATNNGSAGLPTTTPTPPTTPTENLQDLLVRIWLIQHPWLKLQADHSTTPTPSQSPSPTADYNATNNGSAGLPTTTPTPPTTPTENLQDLLVRLWLIQHPWLKLQADHSTTPTPSQSPSPTADYNATNNGSAGLPTTTPTPPTTPTENLQDLLVRLWLLQHPWLKLQSSLSTSSAEVATEGVTSSSSGRVHGFGDGFKARRRNFSNKLQAATTIPSVSTELANSSGSSMEFSTTPATVSVASVHRRQRVDRVL
jgi:hypothetical protein